MSELTNGTPGQQPSPRPRRQSFLPTIVFLVLLATPGLMWPFFAEKPIPSDTPKPKRITSVRGWLVARETGFSDRLPGRTLLIRLHSLLAYAIGASPNRKVVLGSSDHLFSTPHFEQMRRFRGVDPLNEIELASWDSGMRARAEWLESRGIPCIFVVIPAKWTVYSQYMPARFSRVGPSQADQIVERLSRSKAIRVLDLRPEFIKQNEEEQELYYKYDHHWNGYGAFAGYSSIIRSVRELVPAARQLDLQEVAMVDVHYTGSEARLISMEWMLREPSIKVKPADETGIQSKITGPAQGISESVGSTSLPGDIRGLLYADSFCISEIPGMFHASFSASSLRHHNFGKEDFAEVIRFKPNVVVFAMVEFFLPRSLPAPEFPSEDSLPPSSR